MSDQWGALPLGEDGQRPGVCEGCGASLTNSRYEHCDDCLLRAVRGMNAVSRAVEQRRIADLK